MKNSILLTEIEFNDDYTDVIETPVIIGVQNIICIKPSSLSASKTTSKPYCSVITSWGALVKYFNVTETIEQIWQQINSWFKLFKILKGRADPLGLPCLIFWSFRIPGFQQGCLSDGYQAIYIPPDKQRITCTLLAYAKVTSQKNVLRSLPSPCGV